jgi:hypothetical protein
MKAPRCCVIRVRTLLVFCTYFACILYVLCLYFVRTLPVFCTYFACIFTYFACICTHFACILYVLCLYFVRSLPVLFTYFACILYVLWLYFVRTLPLFCTYFPCILYVLCLYFGRILPVLCTYFALFCTFYETFRTRYRAYDSVEISNKMQPCNRIFYSTVHWRLNMFRAAYRSSSRALNSFAASGLHTHVVAGRSQVWVGTGWASFHSDLTTAGHHMRM